MKTRPIQKESIGGDRKKRILRCLIYIINDIIKRSIKEKTISEIEKSRSRG